MAVKASERDVIRAVGAWNREVIMPLVRAAHIDTKGHEIDVRAVADLVLGSRSQIAALMADFEHPLFESAAKADLFLEWAEVNRPDLFAQKALSQVE